MARLPDLLGTDDLPLAELHSAKLDGHALPVGVVFRPLDRPDGPVDRARAAGVVAPARTIVCEESAAWIWGAVAEAPEPVRLCIPARARARPAPSPVLVVREVVIAAPETSQLGGVLVTTAMRTAIDLARAARRPSAAAALRGMLRAALVDPAAMILDLSARPRLAGRADAIEAVLAARAAVSRC